MTSIDPNWQRDFFWYVLSWHALEFAHENVERATLRAVFPQADMKALSKTIFTPFPEIEKEYDMFLNGKIEETNFGGERLRPI